MTVKYVLCPSTQVDARTLASLYGVDSKECIVLPNLNACWFKRWKPPPKAVLLVPDPTGQYKLPDKSPCTVYDLRKQQLESGGQDEKT